MVLLGQIQAGTVASNANQKAEHHERKSGRGAAKQKKHEQLMAKRKEEGPTN